MDNKNQDGGGRMMGAQRPGGQISKRANIDPFIVMDVMQAAHERELSGHDIIHMEVGQPGTAAPKSALERAERAMKEGALGYSLALGLPELRSAIATHYRKSYGLDIKPERIVITTGSSAGFIFAFLACFDASARIALPSPGYPCYRHIARALDLEPVTIETTAQGRWMPRPGDIEAVHNTRPLQGMVLASPANPTGTMISNEGLKGLIDISNRLGIRFISDEIYHGLTYEGRAGSALEYSSDVIVINSFSKYFSMTGWRVGWMIVPEYLVRPIERLAQNLYIAPPTISQYAALGALEAGQELEGNRRVYADNRDLLLQELPRAGFDNLLPADGAFYIYADITDLTNDSVELARKILNEAGVAVTPGLDFDAGRGNRYLRFSYAGTTAQMAEAAKRLRRWRNKQGLS